MVLWLERFADKLISICMILCLILGTIVFSAVMAVQVLYFFLWGIDCRNVTILPYCCTYVHTVNGIFQT
jgi:hypothetical protein